LEEANRFLRERYIAEFNRKFTIQPAEKGTAFRRSGRSDLDWIFSIQTERVVSKDNTVAIKDGALEVAENQPQVSRNFHRPLEIASGDSHFPTPSTTVPSLSPKSKAKRVA
jgi:hypothetical protein